MNIIAEIGWNHLGDIESCTKNDRVSQKAGATVAKFQLWDPEIMKNGAWNKDGKIEIYKKAKLSNEDVLLFKRIFVQIIILKYYSALLDP